MSREALKDLRVTSSRKGSRQTKLWIVHLPDGRTRGFPAHLYTKEQARGAVKALAEQE
jgi:hypothetical protein